MCLAVSVVGTSASVFSVGFACSSQADSTAILCAESAALGEKEARKQTAQHAGIEKPSPKASNPMLPLVLGSC